MTVVKISTADLLTKSGPTDRRRQRVSLVMRVAVALSAFLTILPLVALIIFVVLKAASYVTPSFF